MMSLTFGLFTQVSGSGPLGPLVLHETAQLKCLLGLIYTPVYVWGGILDLIKLHRLTEKKTLSNHLR